MIGVARHHRPSAARGHVWPSPVLVPLLLAGVVVAEDSESEVCSLEPVRGRGSLPGTESKIDAFAKTAVETGSGTSRSSNADRSFVQVTARGRLTLSRVAAHDGASDQRRSGDKDHRPQQTLPRLGTEIGASEHGGTHGILLSHGDGARSTGSEGVVANSVDENASGGGDTAAVANDNGTSSENSSATSKTMRSQQLLTLPWVREVWRSSVQVALETGRALVVGLFRLSPFSAPVVNAARATRFIRQFEVPPPQIVVLAFFVIVVCGVVIINLLGVMRNYHAQKDQLRVMLYHHNRPWEGLRANVPPRASTRSQHDGCLPSESVLWPPPHPRTEPTKQSAQAAEPALEPLSAKDMAAAGLSNAGMGHFLRLWSR
eukprot:TRINITY_DN34308_c0_g1_i1.p1 TRINITY_DN34308_c0_g1~~TRINITY_DN34308_c0_g1_i1.p1  ORF type:complete len:374 (+),score=47.70 TRINITY_DN34308_c0_g1_i1:71-1192(+)